MLRGFNDEVYDLGPAQFHGTSMPDPGDIAGGPFIGLEVITNDASSISNYPIEIALIYNSCPCPATSFSGGIAPSDMTANVGDAGSIT
jgi:hypothetical protein